MEPRKVTTPSLRTLSLLAILTVSAATQPPLSRIRVVTATTEDAARATGDIPHPDRSVPDARVSPRVENWLSQYREGPALDSMSFGKDDHLGGVVRVLLFQKDGQFL